MKIDLRKNFIYSLIVPTSMGVRITPLNGQPVQLQRYIYYAGYERGNQCGQYFFLSRPTCQSADDICKGQPYRQIYQTEPFEPAYGIRGQRGPPRRPMGIPASV